MAISHKNQLNQISYYHSNRAKQSNKMAASSLTTEKAADSYGFVMTLKEVARFTKFSEKKIYRLCKAGEIPFNKIQGQYRFLKTEIERWLKGEAYE